MGKPGQTKAILKQEILARLAFECPSCDPGHMTSAQCRIRTIICYVSVAEVVGPKYRGTAGVATDIFWAVGYMTLGGLAYLIRDWVILQVVLSAALSFQILYFWLVDAYIYILRRATAVAALLLTLELVLMHILKSRICVGQVEQF